MYSSLLIKSRQEMNAHNTFTEKYSCLEWEHNIKMNVCEVVNWTVLAKE
jgi:hypothetical protein